MIEQVTKKIINNDDVDVVEIIESFDEVYSGLANSVQTSAFLTALNFLNNFDDILFSSIKCAHESIKNVLNFSKNIGSIENISCETPFDYIDISLIQDLVCSSMDLPIFRYKFNNDTDINKQFQILKLYGIDFNKDIDYQSFEFEKLNFIYSILPNDITYYKYTNEIQKSLPYDKILKATSLLLNPSNSANIFYGINDKKMVQTYANLFLKLKKENSVVVASDNIPYISICGESFVAEAWKNKIFTYVLSPDLLGFKENELKSIQVENYEQNLSDILDILSGKLKDSKYDVVIINSALSLYISKKADSIIDGINLAKKAIDDGLAFEKLQQIKKFYM